MTTGVLFCLEVLKNSQHHIYKITNNSIVLARLAHSVEHETLNLRVVGSSPTLGDQIFLLFKRV